MLLAELPSGAGLNPAPVGSDSRPQAAAAGSGQWLKAISPTPCSFSATNRSCGVDRSIELFFPVLVSRFLAFPELQSNFPGRCDFLAKCVHHINDFHTLKKNKPICITFDGNYSTCIEMIVVHV